jgi:hypothetical protein
MISPRKKKLVRQKAVDFPPPLQSLFTRENNLNWNNQEPLTRSLSTESSTSNSPNPVVIPTKFFYRRR